MKRVRGEAHGFTIVETLIFLGVSGALFVSALALIGGKQQKVEFEATVRELNQKIQSVMGNVSTGYYANVGKTTCTVSAGKVTDVTSNAASTEEQGKNGNCVFLGQLIEPSTSLPGFTTYGIVGSRLTASGSEENLGILNAVLFDATKDEYRLPAGTNIKVTSGGGAVARFAAVTSSASYGCIGSGLLCSGAASTDIYTNPIFTPDGSVVRIDESQPSHVGTKNPAASIVVCVDNGSQKGQITIRDGSTVSVIDKGVC